MTTPTPPKRGVRPAYIATAAIAFVITLVLIQTARPNDVGGVVTTDGRPTLGAPDAPVQMTVFEDFMCPGCRQFSLEMFPELQRAFVDTGSVHVTHVTFPIVNATSTTAAHAAHCIHQQSNALFWELKAPLYRAQGTLSSERDFVDFAAAYAPDLDPEAMRTCMNAPSTRDAVARDITTGRTIGVNATPTVLIDGVRITPLSNQAIATAIETALEQAR